MAITNYYRPLVLTSALLFGCTPVRQAPIARPAATVTTPVSTPLGCQPTFCAEHFSSLTEAIEPLLKMNSRVVAFGEIHKMKAGALLSTQSYFATEVMPLLAANGYKHLVWESLPSSFEAEFEINNYPRTRQFGPLLAKWFKDQPDLSGVIAIMNAAAENEVSLYGSHAKDPVENYFLQQNETLAATINSRTLTQIRLLLAQEKKVASYTGAQHNNFIPVEGEEERSFGQTLKAELGKNYLEIDLYLPQLMASQPEQYIEVPNGAAFSPLDGVNALRFTNGRHVLILPSQ